MKVELFEGRVIKPFEQKELSGVFILEKESKKRSSGQNRYLHSILFPQLAEGMSKKTNKTITMEFAKEVVKYKFLQTFTDAGTVVMPTSKLNTKQCMEFVEKCQQYGAEMLDISIPSPNETPYNLIQET